MKYMKQLDAFRAFGVMTVIYLHYYYLKLHPHPITICGLPIDYGITAVDTFFLLSGFLITSILLKYKTKIDSGNATVVSCLRVFYQRRTLRIFPIFYLMLFFGFIINISPVRETIWWNVTYMTNLYLAQIGTWDSGSIIHLWSLAVEEQFYLFWPLIILLVPRKRLLGVLILIIAIAPAYRLFCNIYHINKVATAVMTIGNIDLLGLGALLAYIKMHMKDRLPAFTKYCLIFGGTMYIANVVISSLYPGSVINIFTRTFEGILTCWLVNKASDGFGGFVGRVLEFKPLLYIGKISYGLYLYHLFIPPLTPRIMHRFGIQMPESFIEVCILNATITLILASVSWYLIEAPISRLKNEVGTPDVVKSDLNSLNIAT